MTGMSVLQLLPPGGSIVGGSIEFDGHELTTMSRRQLRRLRGNDIAIVFQDPMTSLNPTRTIGSQLREAYRIHRPGDLGSPKRIGAPRRCSRWSGCRGRRSA